MEIKVKQTLLNIKDSLWFIPTIMAVSFAALAFVLIEVDTRVDYDKMPINWFLYGGQRDGARSVLSTIASSMVTIAGVTFSITLVALTMASAQFGPRLLRNFIADRGNQMVIGTFISTFIFSLIVLLSIRSTEDDEFVPKISVAFGFLMAVFSLGVLIYFIHHVTISIQADYVIKSSFREFNDVIKKYMTEDEEEADGIDKSELLATFEKAYSNKHQVHFSKSGFVQSIDFKGVCNWACKHDAVVYTMVYAGDFATIYAPFATVYFNENDINKMEKELREMIVISYQRTPNQDPLFSLKQITEVGVRALSPSTNDPYTANTCIQWLGAAISILSKKKFPRPVERDGTGAIRVVKAIISYEDFVNVCFDQLIHFAQDNVYVMAEILSVLKKAMHVARQQKLKDVLQSKATSINELMRTKHKEAEDLNIIESHYRDIMSVYSRTL